MPYGLTVAETSVKRIIMFVVLLVKFYVIIVRTMSNY